MSHPFPFMRLQFSLKLRMLMLLVCSLPHTGSLYAETRFQTKFEASSRTETATYDEGIAYYEQLSQTFPELQLRTYGTTDSGKPLHLITLSLDREFDFARLHRQDKALLLINNAIHPGEPDGVDASMLLLRDLVLNLSKFEPMLKRVVISVIPFYNVGGVLNRNSTTRVNQNGPKEYGFRGNGRNFDLNRDFIKNDTLNARTFTQIFQELDPDVLVDTHVSNGADYPYVMSIVTTQKDKLRTPLGQYLEGQMLPFLFTSMASRASEMIPYVNVFGNSPENGYSQFFDSPRYSSGYAALFHTLGFMSEAHMLKPFDQRVIATYNLLLSVLQSMSKDSDQIRRLRAKAKKASSLQKHFPIAWHLDTTRSSDLRFKGYEAKRIRSELTGQLRLFYDHERPYEKTIQYANHYSPTITITKPEFYLIPQAWHEVIEALERNQVTLEKLQRDQSIRVESYRISSYQTVETPYEGHYLHHDVKLLKTSETIRFRKGDIKVPVNQWRNRYIVETLEPQGVDSFFAWNFFDTILQRKEGFSAYVFEDEALQILAANDELRTRFEERRASDSEFANNSRDQLMFIYEHSPHHESSYLKYPVYRVLSSENPLHSNITPQALPAR